MTQDKEVVGVNRISTELTKSKKSEAALKARAVETRRILRQLIADLKRLDSVGHSAATMPKPTGLTLLM